MEFAHAQRARLAAEHILEKSFRLSIRKAINPLTESGFLRIVARLTASMRDATEGAEGEALNEALNTLNVDWDGLSAAGRERVFEAAQLAVSSISARVMPELDQTFETVGMEVFEETRDQSIERYGFTIGAELATADVEAADFVRRSATNFIRDQYGVRRDDLMNVARNTVALGLEQGIGSERIAIQLRDAVSAQGVMRSDSYWNTVAMQFTNSARTYSQLSTFNDAGIGQFVFTAVLDEVTTDICRFYDGKTFSTGSALDHVRAASALTDPDAIRDFNPWVREGRDEDGQRVLYVQRGDAREVIAQVDRSGRGNSDDRGSFSRAADSDKLMSMGIPYPPLHGRCRSSIEPLL